MHGLFSFAIQAEFRHIFHRLKKPRYPDLIRGIAAFFSFSDPVSVIPDLLKAFSRMKKSATTEYRREIINGHRAPTVA